ncbi:hypothetical protein MMC32_000383 [Xylographa parallela]|nr:hypothetical protein [Xylographa parallela]
MRLNGNRFLTQVRRAPYDVRNQLLLKKNRHLNQSRILGTTYEVHTRIFYSPHHGAIRLRERAVLGQVEKEYDATVSVQNILEQTSGNTEAINAVFKVGEINSSFPKRVCIAKAFFDSKTASFPETNARAAFVNDVTSRCRFDTRVHTRQRRPTGKLDKIDREYIDIDSEIKLTHDVDAPASNVARVNTKSAAFSIPVKYKPFQCLICPDVCLSRTGSTPTAAETHWTGISNANIKHSNVIYHIPIPIVSVQGLSLPRACIS